MKGSYNGNLARYVGHFNAQYTLKAVFMSTYKPVDIKRVFAREFLYMWRPCTVNEHASASELIKKVT